MENKSKKIGNLFNSGNFEPQPAVGWFEPKLLAQTGISAVISSVFGAFSDKREMQAALDDSKTKCPDFSLEDEIWFDYVADLGDGFNPTYTIAKTLAEPQLQLDGIGTQRGKILVMGGDQVYPKASRELYNDRFKGPYANAFPEDKSIEKPSLFAIPGNHDWYDGLSNFLKIFCQERTIGNWQTCQKRSYFAIQLPHNWWIWGIDIQLESDVDDQQKRYFLEIKKNQMQDGARVILCTAEPSWVSTSKREDLSNHNLHYFEESIICDKNRDIQVALTLAGDLHHYSRYTAGDFHRITSGGGGAFLHPTHNLPDSINLLNTNEDTGSFTLEKCYPNKKESKGMVWRNVLFPYFNKWFTVTLGSYFMVMLSLLHSWVQFVSPVNHRISDEMAKGMLNWHFLGYILGKVATNPLLIFVSIVLGYGIFAFTDTNPFNSVRKKWSFWIRGGFHATMQLLLFIVVYIGLVKMNYTLFPDWIGMWKEVPLVAILSVETFIIGGILSSHLFGFYLLVANRFWGMHDNEAFSAFRSSSYKNFLRLHLTHEKLTIYPVGIKYSSEWKRNEQGVFVTKKAPEPVLIEKPIEILLRSKL